MGQEHESAPSEKTKPTRRRVVTLMLLTAAVAALISCGVVGLLISIFEHKQEGKNPFFRVVELTDETVDPAVWGRNFPMQYDDYRRTVDMERTRYGGSEAMPRTGTQADPRSVVSQSKLDEDPRLKMLWSGYAFAVDFREERGHAYMLEDQTYTQRQAVARQPGTCLNCHASVYAAYRKVGDGDLFRGFEKLNAMPYAEARALVEHPVACIDCHEPETLHLRVTRPAFMEGIRAVKVAEGITDYDVNAMATRQEMRAFVCAQCHVEYYFKGEEKRLTYPWLKGLKADEILAYYEATGFKDWTHAETGAAAIKAQHPEFEMWSQGIHARAGVACADCHMPYRRVGAVKISDHHVRSPLLGINHACQTCHKASEAELKFRVESIQERTAQLRNLAMDAVIELIADIKRAAKGGAGEAELSEARGCHRRAGFLLDFVEAENSMGFHADQESARVLALAIDHARKGQISIRDAMSRSDHAPASRPAGP